MTICFHDAVAELRLDAQMGIWVVCGKCGSGRSFWDRETERLSRVAMDNFNAHTNTLEWTLRRINKMEAFIKKMIDGKTFTLAEAHEAISKDANP